MELVLAHPSKQGSRTMKYKRCTFGCCGRAHALRAVIVRLCYKDFLTSNFADRKGHSEHKSYFIETYLADSGNRDHSESPGRSTMRDRIDGSRKWKPHRGQTVPLSARTTSRKEPTIAVQLSLALQQVPHFHSR